MSTSTPPNPSNPSLPRREDADRAEPAGPACRPPDLSTVCTPCREGRGQTVQMIPVHGHYQCPACGWRDSCCM